MKLPKLSDADVQGMLPGVPGWDLVKGKLHREYKFPDFVHAFGFMATSAIAIERINHHPEWFNVYNRVVVDLTTHDAGGISVRDFELARLLEGIASRLL